MAGSVNGFEDGGIAVHQVLGVVPEAGGRSGMPADASRVGLSSQAKQRSGPPPLKAIMSAKALRTSMGLPSARPSISW